MITRAQITKLASDDGVDAKTVERDYVLTHVAALVARHDTAGSLILKGGTSLRILHFDNYRYSADLDYSIRHGTYPEALDLFRGALARAKLESITKLHLVDDTGGCWIHYEGPLRSERSIKLDLSDNELVVNTEPARPIARWPDVPEAPILAYTRLEVTAEKLRCVLQRFQCRDLLDLDQLLEDGLIPSMPLRSSHERQHTRISIRSPSQTRSKARSFATRKPGRPSWRSTWRIPPISTKSNGACVERSDAHN